MRIVFWSPVHGMARQTSNLLAIALSMAMQDKYKVLITQTQFRSGSLEDAVIGHAGTKEARERFYQDIGIDSLMRGIKRKKMDETDVNNCCVQLLSEAKLMLLPGTKVEQFEIYRELMPETVFHSLQEVKSHFDFVFVDVTPGNDAISRKIIQDAELVVVNLPQNTGVIASFLSEYPQELKNKRLFFLFGSYFSDSYNNLHNLRARYERFSGKNTGSIPVSIGFMDALSMGNTCRFFEVNQECEPEAANYYFMKEVQAAKERLLRFSKAGRR